MRICGKYRIPCRAWACERRSGVAFRGWRLVPVNPTLLWTDATTARASQRRDEPEESRVLWFKCQGQLAHEGKLVAEQVFVQMDEAGRFSPALVSETQEAAEVQLIAKRLFMSPGKLACSHGTGRATNECFQIFIFLFKYSQMFC